MALGSAAGAQMFGDTAPHLSIGKLEQIRTSSKSVWLDHRRSWARDFE